MKNKLIFLILAIIPIGYGLAMLPSMPSTVVIHWNINGQADGYGSKLIYLLLATIPLIIFVCNYLYTKYVNSNNNPKYLNQMVNGLIVFLGIIAILLINQATSNHLQITKVLVILFGLLFIFIGNLLNKLNINRSFGIRIPATLRSQQVWNRTHYIGGYGFVATGIITVIAGAVCTEASVALGVMIGSLLLLITSLTIYAEVLYYRETGHSSLSKNRK